MQRVPGTDATDGYCTLSYSWNYSGDLIKGEDDEYECIDYGKHKLIFKTKEDGSFFDHEIKEVKFEQLLQQLCKDFNIEYIWYDKMCIDQNDKVAKHTEIENMHQIYRSAAYSVAMIPEMSIPESVESVSWTSGIMNISRVVNNEKFHEREVIEKCLDDICQSQWFKRMWTLEEAIMSNHIVFVGRNAHLWNASRIFFGAGFFLSVPMEHIEDLFELFTNSTPSANVALRQAHARVTTKEHDRAYALANVFADIIEVKVNYDIPALSAISDFYSDLIENDLSVLCFGKSRHDYNSTLREYYDLPSWTGIHGCHLRSDAKLVNIDNIEKHILVDRREEDTIEGKIPNHRLQINNCNYVSVAPRQFPLAEEIMSRFISDGGLEFTHYITELSSDKPDHEDMKREMMDKTIAPGRKHPITFLSLIEECDECLVLDFSFKWNDGSSTRIYPVIRKVEQNEEEEQEPTYRSIGVLLVRCRIYYLHDHSSLSDFIEDEDIQNGSFVIV
ncbi:heterokaryon incompatibility protein-domain-containing protein [Circinella umbellata]|nr:heterokaryon incompatibility protein-domain-containing protein [Circinella umbellata]